ncbi:hypothetical protein D9M72_535530 [compost metagenome]
MPGDKCAERPSHYGEEDRPGRGGSGAFSVQEESGHATRQQEQARQHEVPGKPAFNIRTGGQGRIAGQKVQPAGRQQPPHESYRYPCSGCDRRHTPRRWVTTVKFTIGGRVASVPGKLRILRNRAGA